MPTLRRSTLPPVLIPASSPLYAREFASYDASRKVLRYWFIRVAILAISSLIAGALLALK